MRKIKFRGKTQDGKWVYGDLIHSGTDTIAILELDAPCLELVTDVVPDTIGQFTGLQDKNGKEIYFGDIIRNKWGGLGVVVWEECSVNVNWGGVDSHTLFYEEDFEHIGNIHDSPIFLTDGND